MAPNNHLVLIEFYNRQGSLEGAFRLIKGDPIVELMLVGSHLYVPSAPQRGDDMFHMLKKCLPEPEGQGWTAKYYWRQQTSQSLKQVAYEIDVIPGGGLMVSPKPNRPAGN